MQTEEKLKQIVKEKYAEIANQSVADNKASCCGAGGCSNEVYNIMSDDYTTMEGYNENADLGLGCGLPTQFAQIKPGDVVVDLGSGAGNDCFVARAQTGEKGKVIGIDFTPAMIQKARNNADALGFNNVEFREGDIEHMPLGGNMADVVVSNCVLNLVPNKDGVFKEIYRVLKPGGHFSISDVVIVGQLPEAFKRDAEMYAGCVAGAIQKDVYLELIQLNHFENITVQKEKPIIIPNDILKNYLSEAEIAAFNNGGSGIFSITVYAEKPKAIVVADATGTQSENVASCCTPGGGCC